MFELACVASIVLIGFCLSVLFRKKIEETLSVSCFIIILLLYLKSSITGSITAADVYGVYALAAVLFLAALAFSIIKRKEKLYKLAATPGFAAFLVFAILLYIQTNGLRLTGFDEFTHWGLAVKNMYYLETLPASALSTTVFKSYPPALALFQFFFVKLGTYQDGALIYAYNILMVSLLIPCFSHFNWKQWITIPVLMAVIYLLPLTITYEAAAWYTIYSDCMLAVILAYILFTYFTMPKTDIAFTVVSICCGMMLLALTKPTGSGIGVLAWGMICADSIAFRKQRRKIEQCFLVFASIAALGLAYFSWKIVLNVYQVSDVWQSKTDFSGIVSLFLGTQEAWRYDIILSFLNELGSNSLLHTSAFQITYYGWMAVWALMFLPPLCIIRDRQVKKQIKLIVIGVEVGFLLYCCSLLFFYLFIVSKAEGLILASFTRYLSDYMTGVTIFTFLYVIYLFTSLRTKESLHPDLGVVSNFAVKSIVPLFLALLMLIAPVSKLTAALLAPNVAASTSRYIRADFSATENLETVLDRNTDRVFIVIQDDNSYDYWMSLYNLAPLQTNAWNTWKVTSAYDEWIDELKAGKYSYVFIDNVDTYFTDVFGGIFADGQVKSKTLYKIQYDGESAAFVQVDW